MSQSTSYWTKSSLLGCAAVGALMVGMFGNVAAALADDDATETIVVTGTRFNAEAAPAKAEADPESGTGGLVGK
ncbi:MAG: hypothetical protein ACLQUZ_10315 [Rhizomicrobium sp.]